MSPGLFLSCLPSWSSSQHKPLQQQTVLHCNPLAYSILKCTDVWIDRIMLIALFSVCWNTLWHPKEGRCGREAMSGHASTRPARSSPCLPNTDSPGAWLRPNSDQPESAVLSALKALGGIHMRSGHQGKLRGGGRERGTPFPRDPSAGKCQGCPNMGDTEGLRIGRACDVPGYLLDTREGLGSSVLDLSS